MDEEGARQAINQWVDKATQNQTKDQDFTLANGSKVKTPLMHKSEKTQYMAGDNFQMVSIPYKDNALSMVVLLPKKADGLPALEKLLTATNVAKWLKQMTKHQV